ncbi:MAG: hypothetical protein IH969_09000 [Candidatus Krumholzibacteriota bacterium]|nr:hypothetical protein [Candidatus Krumholzibacteriota bacterium]
MNTPDLESPGFKELVLDRIKIGCETVISGHALNSIDFNAEKCIADDVIRCMTRIEMLGRNEWYSDTKKVYFSYPDGPWQMFKSRFMPNWFKRIFRVRKRFETAEVTFKVCIGFPDIEGIFPKGHDVRFVVMPDIRTQWPIEDPS